MFVVTFMGLDLWLDFDLYLYILFVVPVYVSVVHPVEIFTCRTRQSAYKLSLSSGMLKSTASNRSTLKLCKNMPMVPSTESLGIKDKA